jgi:hypothetical protein
MELREKRKEKKEKKQWICQGYLILLPVVPSQLKHMWARSSCLTLHQAVMHFEKLV